MASADRIEIRITGAGGHASAPHYAKDPIPVACEIVMAVGTAVTRQVDVFDPAVVTFGQISGGTAYNVIPETATLVGTVRAVSEERRSHIHAMLAQIAEGIAAAHGVTAELKIERGYPVTVNDGNVAAIVSETAGRLVGGDRVVEMPSPIMGAEDWSYVLQEVPGVMAFLGAMPPEVDPDTAPANHSNRVRFDEEAMPTGVALYAAVARHFLNG